MAQIFIFSDIHCDLKSLKRIVAQKADVYVCLGDLSDFGEGLEKAGRILFPLREKLLLIPGNNETDKQIKELSVKYNFVDFHQKIKKIGNFVFAGLGYSTPTPFNTPGEMSEEEFERKFKSFENLQNLCLFVHNPPRDTQMDILPNGVHVGGQAVRDFIENYQPLYLFCGHIHENEGKIERVGKTTCFSVGKRGLKIWL